MSKALLCEAKCALFFLLRYFPSLFSSGQVVADEDPDAGGADKHIPGV